MVTYLYITTFHLISMQQVLLSCIYFICLLSIRLLMYWVKGFLACNTLLLKETTLLTFIEYFLSLISALFLSRSAWYQERPLGDPYCMAPGLGGRGGSMTGGGSGEKSIACINNISGNMWNPSIADTAKTILISIETFPLCFRKSAWVVVQLPLARTWLLLPTIVPGSLFAGTSGGGLW